MILLHIHPKLHLNLCDVSQSLGEMLLGPEGTRHVEARKAMKTTLMFKQRSIGVHGACVHRREIHSHCFSVIERQGTHSQCGLELSHASC